VDDNHSGHCVVGWLHCSVRFDGMVTRHAAILEGRRRLIDWTELALNRAKTKIVVKAALGWLFEVEEVADGSLQIQHRGARVRIEIVGGSTVKVALMGPGIRHGRFPKGSKKAADVIVKSDNRSLRYTFIVNICATVLQQLMLARLSMGYVRTWTVHEANRVGVHIHPDQDVGEMPP
jgi:hypothetical protein